MEVGDLVYHSSRKGRVWEPIGQKERRRGVLIEKRFPYNWLIIDEHGNIVDRHEAFIEVINENR